MSTRRVSTAPVPTERQAVYATCETGVCFRIGQPVKDAYPRYARLDRNGTGLGPSRPLHVRFDGKRHRVRFLEVRQVDSHGRGLGSERHALAFPVPHRNCTLVR